MEPRNSGVEYVTLVALDTLTPYKKGEVFTLPKDQADKVLNVNTRETDFGRQNPVVKARVFVDGRDDQLLLDNKVLNAVEHRKLERKLHPEDEK